MSTIEPGLVAVQAGDTTTCGAIVWWALGGVLDLEELMDAWDAEGLDRAIIPGLPTPETALYRAALECQDKRTLVRPLDRRGMWDIVSETVLEDTGGAPRTVHSTECRIEIRPDKSALVVPEDHRFADKVLHAYRVYARSLNSADISMWLTATLMPLIEAVGLRERGGMYFVPVTGMALLRRVARAFRACSRNLVYEVPALKTDDAVEAILTAVRAEAEHELGELEEYMARPAEKITTKGLNAGARRATAIRSKLERYASLLGVALPDMNQRAETLAGAIQAAKLIERTSVAAQPRAGV